MSINIFIVFFKFLNIRLLIKTSYIIIRLRFRTTLFYNFIFSLHLHNFLLKLSNFLIFSKFLFQFVILFFRIKNGFRSLSNRHFHIFFAQIIPKTLHKRRINLEKKNINNIKNYIYFKFYLNLLTVYSRPGKYY